MSRILLIALFSLVALGAAPPLGRTWNQAPVQRVNPAPPLQQPPPTPIPTESPAPTPTPEPDPPPSVVQGEQVRSVIHRLLFPAETMGEALTNIFNQAAGKEAESLSQQAAAGGEAIGEVVQAPSEGWFRDQARASLPPRRRWPRLSSFYAWRSITGTG